MTRVLVVEDDRALLKGLCALLRGEGHAVDEVRTGEEALELESGEPYGIVILDIALPGMSGFDTLRELRARGSATPVLILTARDARDDRVRGLDLGADDYLGKPFDSSELLARVRALIRRNAGIASPLIVVGHLMCDPASGTARVNDRTLSLRRREWSVLLALASRAGKVVAKERLLAEVFDYDDPVGNNAIEVYITRLRQKLGSDGPAIRNLRGLGYMMDAR